MPALSKKQQKFFGIVRSIQKGEQTPTTPETAKAAADMKKSDVKKFASTKHKGLPEKKVTKEGYGNPNVGPALKMARMIDKTKPGAKSKRAKVSQYLKRREMEGDKKKYAAVGEEVKISEDKQIKKIVKQLRKSVNSHAKQADTLEKKIEEGSLHKWFKGSKSKDGKPGWVNVKTGGTCASDEPGEGTPKCVSSSKRASMTKSERESASRRKKAADPGQQSKTGAAKPTYVSTDKPKKKMKEEIQITESDKKGKGSGTKDACYTKVKSRYSVWPSAYASGALVKCRKVGAANWGNSSKKEEFEPDGISFQQFQEKCWKGYKKKGMKTMFGKRYPNCVKEEETLDEKCWDTHKQVGMKKKGGKMVPNCVPKNEEVQRDEYGDPIGGPKISKKQKAKNLTMNEPDKQHTTDTSEGMAYGISRGSGKPSGQMSSFGKKKKENPYSLKNKLKMVIRGAAEKQRAKAGVTSEEMISERQKDSDNQRLSQERGRSNYGKASVRNVRATGTGGNAADPADRLVAMTARHKEHEAKRGVKTKVKEDLNIVEDDMKGMSVKSGHKRPTKSGAGMTQKGVEAYRRKNPGSKLKTAVTTEPSKLKKGSKSANRRKSYCARSAGQMKKFPKAAKDPDSRLRQARRRWNC